MSSHNHTKQCAIQRAPSRALWQVDNLENLAILIPVIAMLADELSGMLERSGADADGMALARHAAVPIVSGRSRARPSCLLQVPQRRQRRQADDLSLDIELSKSQNAEAGLVVIRAAAAGTFGNVRGLGTCLAHV